jgi:hypothetical protein
MIQSFNILRKVLLLPVFLFLWLQAGATLTDGSVSPDLTLTDINGNTFNLYQELGSGKTVFLEFVAAWNDNCWNYHQAQHLQSLYAQHGPQGTCSDDVIVVMIEADLSTGLDMLDGTSPLSAGDWISETPYPIFNPASDDIIDDFLVTSFPTIYRICPSKIVKSNGQISAAAHAATIDMCNILNDVSIRESSSFYYCDGLVEPKVLIGNVAYPFTLSSAEISLSVDNVEQSPVIWAGNIAPGQDALFSLPSISLTPGLHEISCSIVNLADNAPDLNPANNCLSFFVYVSDGPVDVSIVNQDFSDPDFTTTGWVIDNPDMSNTWQHTSHEGGMAMIDFYSYGDIDQADAMLVGPFQLPANEPNYLSFDLAYAPYNETLYDGLGIAISSDCGNTWTDVYFKEGNELATAEARTEPFYPYPGNWRSECISLENFAGNEELLIGFIGLNGWGNNLFLDNINLGTACIVSDESVEFAAPGSLVFPNPADDMFNLNTSAFTGKTITCSLKSISGAQAYHLGEMTCYGDQSNLPIDCSRFESGVYLLNILCEQEAYVTRLVIVH